MIEKSLVKSMPDLLQEHRKIIEFYVRYLKFVRMKKQTGIIIEI